MLTLFLFDALHDGRPHEDEADVGFPELWEARVQACRLLSDTSHADASDGARRVVSRATMRYEGPQA